MVQVVQAGAGVNQKPSYVRAGMRVLGNRLHQPAPSETLKWPCMPCSPMGRSRSRRTASPATTPPTSCARRPEMVSQRGATVMATVKRRCLATVGDGPGFVGATVRDGGWTVLSLPTGGVLCPTLRVGRALSGGSVPADSAAWSTHAAALRLAWRRLARLGTSLWWRAGRDPPAAISHRRRARSRLPCQEPP